MDRPKCSKHLCLQRGQRTRCPAAATWAARPMHGPRAGLHPPHVRHMGKAPVAVGSALHKVLLQLEQGGGGGGLGSEMTMWQGSGSEPIELDLGCAEYYHWHEQAKLICSCLLERFNEIELPTSVFYHHLAEVAQRHTWLLKRKPGWVKLQSVCMHFWQQHLKHSVTWHNI